MTDEYSVRNPIFDNEIPLESGIIADMLGLFLKSEPDINPATLPAFRVDQLFNYLKSCRCVITAEIIEYTGCLLALTLHFATNKIDDKELLMKLSVTLGIVLTECHGLMAEALIFVHPSQRMKQLKDLDSLGSFEYQTFCDAMKLIKDIIRDIVRQVRSARDLIPKRYRSSAGNVASEKVPLDCYQLHSIYFACLFALSHVAILAISEGDLNASLGVIESCVLGFVSLPKIDSVDRPSEEPRAHPHVSFSLSTINPSTPRESIKNIVDRVDPDTPDDLSRFDQCLDLSSKLSLCVLRRLPMTELDKVESSLNI